MWLQNVRTLGVTKDANWKDFFEASPNPVPEVMAPKRFYNDGNEIKIESLKKDVTQSTLITEPSLSSLSVWQRFPDACCLCFLPEEKTHHEKRAKQRLQTLREHPTVQCSRVWFSRSQRCYRSSDRWWASCHHLQKWSCRTLWPHKMWSAWDRPGSQTPRRSCGSALDPRFRIGNSSARKVQTGMSKWPCGNSKDGGWNMRMERVRGRDVTCALQTLWAMCVRVCMSRNEEVQRKCACDTECVCTPRRTHSRCHYAGAKSGVLKKKQDFVIP